MQMCTLLDSKRRKSQFIHNGKRGIPLQEHLLQNGKKKNQALTTYPANEKVGGEYGKKRTDLCKDEKSSLSISVNAMEIAVVFRHSLCTLRSVFQGRKLKQLSKSKIHT